MNTTDLKAEPRRLPGVGSSELVRCADYQAGKFRCPVVRGRRQENEAPPEGRLLFQILPSLYDFTGSDRLEKYLSQLPVLEANRKLRRFRDLQMSASR